MQIDNILSLVILIGLSSVGVHAQESDLLVADFEGTNYAPWSVTGTAFGNAPARGTLPGQMKVDGFQGKGLVNSYQGGDGATGTLTSPPFKIERKDLQFLIGGGGWEAKTCLNLLLDGKVVRTATGPNTEPGGSERLQPAYWDVSDLMGKQVVLQIVDDATGGWGHINVDQIVQTDKPTGQKSAAIQLNATRDLLLEKRYLNLPVKNGGPKRQMHVLVAGQPARDFEIELADGQPDWWAFMDVAPFKGRHATLKVDRLPEDSAGLGAIDQSDAIKNCADLYQEPLRPQFHFTSRRGWLNDPNGLVFYQGEYHLFYQHNPYGWNWGNMHWGHAVSRDLVHWRELPEALYPDEHGTMYSGSAVVDWNNTAGFQSGSEPALVAMVTAAGRPFTQELAYSNDRGRTWTKYQNNPVLGHLAAENRDPKVVWFAPGKKWVMALYLDHSDYALFSSPDLKHWQKLSDVNLPGDSECPNFFEVPLDGNTNDRRWVFFGASGVYLVGKFDGKTFTPETKPQRLHNGNCWYAAQVYSDIPAGDGRCLLIPWGRLPNAEIFRGMPFNQMMGMPVELALRTTEEGPRLLAVPVKELAQLRTQCSTFLAQPLKPGENPLAGVTGELLDVVAELTPGEASELSFNLRGVEVNYNVSKQELSCLDKKATLKPVRGTIRLRLLVDRASIDIFGDDGRLYLPMAMRLPQHNLSLNLSAKGGSGKLNALEVYQLRSAWKNPEQ